MEDEPKDYDLEERTFQFALAVRNCIAANRWTRVQWSDIEQVLRSSGSVGSNYTEANNAVSKADFIFRIKPSKKESRETMFWLRMLGETTHNEPVKKQLRALYKESDELTRILATILRNSL
jgi:four helix bundle protein